MGKASLALVTVFLAAALAAQDAPPAPKPADQKPAARCSVEGQVVRASDGAPLKKASVTLFSVEAQGKQSPKSAITGEDGHFLLRDLDPGRYNLMAARNGFIRQTYGDPQGSALRAFGGAGTILNLTAGQHIKDILFRLVSAAAISGQIVDEDGEAMPGIRVEALHPGHMKGQRELVPTGFGVSNDLGEYRLALLPPGRYYIRASWSGKGALGIGGGVMFRDAGESASDQAYPPVYYPGVLDAAQAVAVEVRGGDDLPGFNFRFTPTHAVRVSGRIINTLGKQSEGGFSVNLLPRGSRGFTRFGGEFRADVQEDGRFQIRGVLPGSYTLHGSWFHDNKQYTAMQKLDVGNADIDNLLLTIREGAEVTGRLELEGTADLRRERVHISLQPEDTGSGAYFGGDGQLQSDMTFTVKNVPEGAYRLNVYGLPEDCYVKAARIGPQDVLESGITVSGGRVRMSITVSAAGGRVDGSVLNDKNEPVSRGIVVLVPELARRSQFALYRTARPDQYGKFSLRGITPGSYKLFAWESIEAGVFQDPDFLREHEDEGTSVRVSESAKLNQELKVLPSPAEQ